jgi:hypothetical protein
MVINRLGPLSVAKISGVLYAMFGLLAGAVFSLAALAGATGSETANPFGPLMGIGAIVVLPIVYGVLGFVASLLAALLYNLIAGLVGGIEVDVT